MQRKSKTILHKYTCIVCIKKIYIYSLHKKEDIYVDISNGVKIRFEVSNYERSLPKGEDKKGIRLMKDELGKNVTT